MTDNIFRPYLRDCPMCHASGQDSDDPAIYFIEHVAVGYGTRFTMGYEVRCCNCGCAVHEESEQDAANRWNGVAANLDG